MTRDTFHDKVSIDLKRLEKIFNYIKNGITITDQYSAILYINPAFSAITGYSKEEVLGGNPGMLHSGRHGKHFYQDMWQAIARHGYWEGEIWNRRKSGEIFPEFLTISKVTSNESAQTLYIGIFSDISFLKKDIHKRLHLAFYDPLTELPNRNLYLDRVNETISRAKNDKTIAILFMDLDKFKPVNDTYGHIVGDKLLKSVGERMAGLLHKGDTIARIGGDEFAGILSSFSDKPSIEHFAQSIIMNIEKPFMIDGRTIEISISIGISLYPQDDVDVSKLLNDADQAMYHAKRSKAKLAFYSS